MEEGVTVHELESDATPRVETNSTQAHAMRVWLQAGENKRMDSFVWKKECKYTNWRVVQHRGLKPTARKRMQV